MNGYDAQDMATQGADGFRNGYQAGYADAVKAVEVGKPAAAQEAVAWQVGDDFYTSESLAIEGIQQWGPSGSIAIPLYAAPVAAAPVDGRDVRSAIAGLEGSVAVGSDGEWVSVRRAARDEAVMALRNVSLDCAHIYAAYSEAKASTPAAPGIDLSEIPRYTLAHGDFESEMLEHSRGAWVRLGDVESVLIDASPKGGSTSAPRFELTNGQIAQLHDFAGTPVAGVPLEDQDVLVIQHADAGHSGPGMYAHYDELPEEGAIYLDGQLPDSPQEASDA